MTQQSSKGELTHEVICTLPDLKVGKAMLAFEVKKGGKKMGTLHISRGSIYWVPKGKQLAAFKKARKGIEWEELAAWFKAKNK